MWVQSAAFVGFLGGYTTFSAMMLDMYALIERGRFGVAGAYAVGSVAGGIVAVFAGVLTGRALA
jgi:fluoride exporter